jgi:hypothetical protein
LRPARPAPHGRQLSGETAAQIVDGQPGRPAQIEAVTAATRLVTLNDVGHIPRLTVRVLRPLQQLLRVRGSIAELRDTADEHFEALAGTFDRLLTGVRRREPQATSRMPLPGGIIDQPRPPRPVRPALDDWVFSLTARECGRSLNAAGMRAVADLLVDTLGSSPRTE